MLHSDARAAGQLPAAVRARGLRPRTGGCGTVSSAQVGARLRRHTRPGGEGAGAAQDAQVRTGPHSHPNSDDADRS